MDWTDDTIARLRDLWSQGLSTAEIGRQLSITKNAVVGKAHRLGLPPRPSPIRNRPVKDGVPGEAPPRRKSTPRGGKAAAAAAAANEDLLQSVAAVVAAPAEAAAATTPASAEKVAPAVAPAASKPAPAAVRPVAVPRAVVEPARKEPVVAPVAPAPRPAAARPVPSRFQEGVDRPVRRGPSCCWPIGDPGTPGFHFCGARPLSGKPYCAEHAAIAYVKIRDRRDGG
ncbi:GcrA family cell cycle regulator [Gluconobacter wancherniae]|uniref:GcrA cell cycle regulator n=3 Tax=Gluconobacter wancherniae TaxID=1307955 RepID=A0A511B3H4_9PROT|nr:GcrA family cell cycle regulator [Gluconobacter wancherniae]MBF0854101.1 GcrA cell cycle regulator [Gluconobacter wancherniae]GBD57157.1 GcrA cell cycle regulator [Gluconobacter wancherniae NBRC 103581]GEK94071.1 hypothetical protein GWA01_18410 [Gluconobacter wancherniae NBRC 103581]